MNNFEICIKKSIFRTKRARHLTYYSMNINATTIIEPGTMRSFRPNRLRLNPTPWQTPPLSLGSFWYALNILPARTATSCNFGLWPHQKSTTAGP